jgi:hypothetical protein
MFPMVHRCLPWVYCQATKEYKGDKLTHHLKLGEKTIGAGISWLSVFDASKRDAIAI